MRNNTGNDEGKHQVWLSNERLKKRRERLRTKPVLWLLLAFLAPLLSWRARRLAQQIPRLQPAGATAQQSAQWPTLSIIVPARNEAANLQRLLPSLKQLIYPGRVEIIVVDDGSTDETAAVAAQHAVTLLQIPDLPAGWLGKPYACHQGAAVASGGWLLFTDADTAYTAGGLPAVIAHALAQQLDAVTLFLAEETDSKLVKLVMAIAFAGLFAGLKRPEQVFLGQFILVRRAVYEQSGGFAAVRGELLEDLALGNLWRQLGYRVGVLYGEVVGAVTGYQNIPQLWAGLTRLGSGSLKWSGATAGLTPLFVTALMMPLLALVAWARKQVAGAWVVATWLAAVVSIRPWAGRAGVAGHSWLAPLGALLVQLASSWGLVRQLLGRGVSWKGRKVQ